MAELKKVTITGADNNSDIFKMIELSKKYPFVEWGILVSKSNEGLCRFPSQVWIAKLLTEFIKNQTSRCFSMHICGSILRDGILFGNWDMLRPLHLNLPDFSRIQLNFHGEYHDWDDDFYDGLMEQNKQIIFQIDGKNNHLYDVAINRGVNCVPFFDVSHGAGILPPNWPTAIDNYCGYAGGLSPDNVIDELYKIRRAAVESNFWIDAETGVRTDGELDFEKVDKFLERSEAFIPDHF